MKLLLLLELEAIAGMWAWSVTVKRKKRLAAKGLLLLLILGALNAVGQTKPKPVHHRIRHTHQVTIENYEGWVMIVWAYTDDGKRCAIESHNAAENYWDASVGKAKDDPGWNDEHIFQTKTEVERYIGRFCKP